MAASPKFKVYDANAKYQAACKEPEAAALVVGFYGPGSTIRYEHGATVWREGNDGQAQESYDVVAATVWARVTEINEKSYIRAYGRLPEGYQR